MNVQQLLENLNQRMSASASVKNVYAEPVVVGGRTVIPAAEVRYAMGAGGGPRSEESGGGGGGKVAAKPCGALEITATGTRFIAFGDRQRTGVALALGFILGAAVVALTGTKRIEIKRPA